MVTLPRTFLIVPLAATLALAASFAPTAGAKGVAKYKTCDTAKVTLVPAKGGWLGCYVTASKANIAFAQKAVDKRFTDVMEPEGDNLSNLPEGKIDCKGFFDRKTRGSTLHCIRTFEWTHKHTDGGAHRGTCQYGVGMTYTFGGITRKGGRSFVKYVPAAAPYAYALTQQEFKDTFGTALVPNKVCRSWVLHQGGDPGAEDPLDLAPLNPPLDEA